jgi:hypothetical protein
MLDERHQMELSATMPSFTYQLVFEYPDGAIRLLIGPQLVVRGEC